MRIRQPAALVQFVTLVIAIGVAIIGHSVYRLPETPQPGGWLLLGVLAVVAASFALKVPGIQVYLSISDAFFITSALLFGPAPATLTIALDSLVVSVRRRNTLQQLLFNTTSNALALWCGAQVFYELSPHGPMASSAAMPGAAIIPPLACLAVVYFGFNSGLTAMAVALSKGMSPWQVWRQHFAVISLNYLAAASASFFLVLLGRTVGVAAIAAVLPLILICHLAMRSWLGRVDDAQRHLEKVNQLYLSTVSALATAIEAKDGVTSDHIHRVQGYAMGLARALNVTDEPTLQAIEAAALLHDTGKLAIPEHILNKPGKLTALEFETMKSHVDVGADILSSIDFPYPVVPIVRAHHENWNGTGYPGGLRGEEIPIGARILSVVDCFDALTSDRPYRPAMTEAEALAVLVESRGSKYDPRVVDTFVRVHREIAAKPAPPTRLRQAPSRIGRGQAAVAPEGAATQATASDTSADRSDRLLAFVSLARVASRTPTVADIGALARGYISDIAPNATFVLFTVEAHSQTVRAQYAAGVGAASLEGMTIGLADRLTGWVAANARSVANSDARLDLLGGTPNGLRFACASPLIADGAVAGALTLYSPEPLAIDQSRMLDMIAPHLAVAVAAASANNPVLVSAPQGIASHPPRSGLRVVARR